MRTMQVNIGVSTRDRYCMKGNGAPKPEDIVAAMIIEHGYAGANCRRG